MNELDVRAIIRKVRDENCPDVFGCVVVLLCVASLLYAFSVVVSDYKALKARVEQLKQERATADGK